MHLTFDDTTAVHLMLVIDENNHLTDMEMDSLRRIQLKLLAKLIQVEWEAEADIDENDIGDINKLSVDRVQGTYEALRKVAGRYDVLADPLNFELLPEYKDSNNALQELMQNVRKQFRTQGQLMELHLII